MINIPRYFFEISYNEACYPGSTDTNGLTNGANCQWFAYELLRYFGLEIPNFRSSELWEDVYHTYKVENFEPLDLLLWNSSKDPWGAHVGVYIEEQQAIHLSRKVGRPVIWPLSRFIEQKNYRFFIGAKRVRSVLTPKPL